MSAQIVTECPQNIGFESGTFSNWKTYTGFISQSTGNNPVRPATISLSTTQPQTSRHTLILRGDGNDYFGDFSLDSPNGSDYVVRLGNDLGGRNAESISYTLNVPADVEAYSIIFNYAVVLQNPNHDLDEQPKFTAKVTDLNTGEMTECGSFEFTAPGSGNGIPGFMFSAKDDSVLYKPWAPVMVNLSANLGHTVRLDFTTNDCSRGKHFGYAYIDFNENCSIPVIGNITCPETNTITLNTISGMDRYIWFDATSGETLGLENQLTLSPLPPIGTKIGVHLIPYPGLGCAETLYTRITGMYMNINDPPEKCAFVDITATAVTVGNSSDLTYSYWKDEQATVVLTDPRHVMVGGTYYIKGKSSSGCTSILPVKVLLKRLQSIQTMPPATVSYPETVDITNTFFREKGLKYSYWKDPGATLILKDSLRIRIGGTYYIKAANSEGCTVITPMPITIILPDFVIPNTFTPNGDGVNDEFTILISDKIAIKRFSIFNRWGQMVYFTNDIYQYWKGVKDNAPVPVGVYYWVLDAEEEIKHYKKAGWVTVLR